MVIDVEKLLADEHEIYTKRTMSEKHGIHERTVVRWARSGRITEVCLLGTQLFYLDEETDEIKGPLCDKGEKRKEGGGIEKWFDPFQLT